MKILAIDTSSKICSVALLEDKDLVLQKDIDDEKTHSQKLMPLIDKILKECNIELNDIDLFSCSVGPGSFTGVRIGVSTVKAFCDITNIPVTSISSLEGLAYNILESNFKNESDIICSLIDAKNNNVYCGIFERKEDSYIQIGDLYAKNIDEIIEILKNYSSSHIIFVGDGAKVHKYKILEHYSNVTFVEDKINEQSALSVGRCGYDKYISNNYGDSNTLSPLYLKKSQAERALEGEK